MNRRKWLVFAGLFVAGLALAAACGGGDSSPTPTETPGPPTSPPTLTPRPTPERPTPAVSITEQWAAAYNEDVQKRRFDQEIAGILVGPGVVEGESGICEPGEARWVGVETVAGSAVDVQPGYLPEGATLLGGEATACGDTIVYSAHEYRVPYVAGTDTVWGDGYRTGGTIAIRRTLRPNNTLRLFAASERISGGTIDGSTAIFARPVMPDGLDVGLYDGVIAIQEANGFTVLQGRGVPWSEFIHIAEGLER